MQDLKKLLDRIERNDRKRLAPIYERHGIERKDGTKALAREICLDGSNTIASIFRGWEGVDYREIVDDVASKLGVKDRDELGTEELEHRILAKVAEKYWASLSEKERNEIEAQLKKLDKELTFDKVRMALEGAGSVAMAIMRKAIVQVMTQIIVKVLLRYGFIEASKRAAAVAGAVVPGLNVLLGAWTVVDLAGPAFRKTIPTVIELALLRLELEVNHG